MRLSSEGVCSRGRASAGGPWVVRVAPVDLSGMPSIETIARRARDALLAALAAGPDDDALVLWTEPQPSAGGRPDMAAPVDLRGARHRRRPGELVFDEAEAVAPPAPVADASVAFDPDNDRAVAVWRGESRRDRVLDPRPAARARAL